MNAVHTPLAESPAKLLDVRAIAKRLDCSTRHVFRLSDAGRMPAPLKLGALVRWRVEEIDQWIADGCPRCRKVKGGKQ